MTAEGPCMLALAERAELIRAAEVRRCQTLRNDAQLQALADQVSAAVVTAVFDPVRAYLERREEGGDAEQRVRRIFDLPGVAA